MGKLAKVVVVAAYATTCKFVGALLSHLPMDSHASMKKSEAGSVQNMA